MDTYSLILLDIDGTLLDSRDQISPDTVRLLGRLEKRGIPVVLCSARPPVGVEMVERQAGIHGPIVCYGGSLVLDRDRSILEDTGIEAGTALRFRETAARIAPDVTVTSYLYDVWLVDDRSDRYVRAVMERYGYEAVEGPLEAAVRSVGHVHKIMCMGGPRDLERLRTGARADLPDLAFALSGPTYLEVLTGSASKRTAMETLCRHLGVDPRSVVALGDYYVDIEMLRGAGLGIAMGNAPEAVKRAAAGVTASNDEEGVYIALKNLHFRPPVRRPKSDAD